MSQSTRFIMVAIGGWIGLRAVSLGLIPGGEANAIDRSARASPSLPPVAATLFAPDRAGRATRTLIRTGRGLSAALRDARPCRWRVTGTLYIPAGQSAAPPAGGWGPEEAAGFSLAPAATRYASATPLEQWPLDQIASGSSAPTTPRAQTPAELIRMIPGIDRLSMSAWAMMRGDAGSQSLATNGQLGGSQAGTRLLWRFDRRLAASLRTSAPIGGAERSAEIAAGLRWQPFTRIPAALTVERRQSFGPDKSRSAFALFAEGGVYDRPVVAGFNLDAYFQGGVVGVNNPDPFLDGSATLTRPVWRRLSAGFGLWGGAQPGLARLDAGPRATLRIGRAMRVHLDYRHRLVGQAEPRSGPVVTLAGDF